MNKELEQIIDAQIEAEGGDKYTDDPLDRGGPTRWGITQFAARAFGYKDDMRELPREVAVFIYAARYWYGPQFNKVHYIDKSLASVCLSWGITSGPSRPSKALQRCLNVLNREAKDYPDIAVDGRIGEITIQALEDYNSRRDINVLTSMVTALRSVFYIEIAENDSSQERFENGWQARTFSI